MEVERGEDDGRPCFRIRHPSWLSPKLWDTESNWNWVDACFELYLKDAAPPRTSNEERILKKLRDRVRILESERSVLLEQIEEIEGRPGGLVQSG